EAAAVHGHEVDALGRDRVGGHGEIALVLAILVVDEDHHLAGADLIERAVDAHQHGGVDGQAVRHAVHQPGLRPWLVSSLSMSPFEYALSSVKTTPIPGGSSCTRTTSPRPST